MKLSVVIQTKNQHQHLKRCLEALKGQSDKDFEVIVVDQSRNRKTKPVIKPYNLKYYRIKNGNPAHGRNFGINASFGDIVVLLDCEGTPGANWIASIKKRFKDKKVSIVTGNVVDKTDVHNPITTFQNGIVSKYGEEQTVRKISEKILKGESGLYSVGSPKNVAFLKAAVLKVRGIDERMSETHDVYDLCVRIVRSGGGNLVYDPEILLTEEHVEKHNVVENWRRHAHNLAYFSIKNSSGNFVYRIFKTFWKLFSNRGPYALTVKALFARDTFILSLPFLWTSVNIGTLQGLYNGVYRRRKLRNFATALTKDYLIFAKR